MSGNSTTRRILGGSIGSFVELYDFFIYAFSVPALALHFFPESNPTTALLATFAVYAAGFIMRPVGGILFGFLGDRVGRVRMLMVTITLMGVATMLTGLLPTYQQIGIVATILLVICRLGQGLSLGGESSGAYSFMLESAPKGKRAQWISINASSSFIAAAIVSLFVLSLRFAMGDDVYMDWGWRIPFIVGGLLGAVGIWIRMRLDDPEEFVEARDEQPTQNPLLIVVKAPRKIINVLLLSSSHAVTNYLIQGYMYTFLLMVAGLSQVAALLTTCVAMTICAVLFPVFGFVADRIGRKPLLIFGTIWLAVTVYPAFLLASSGSVWGAAAGLAPLIIASACCVSAGFTTQAELFPTSVRYSGHAIATNVGNALFGGTAPLIAAAMVSYFGAPVAPAYYVIAVGIFAFVVVLFTPETRDFVLRSAEIDTTSTLDGSHTAESADSSRAQSAPRVSAP